VDKATTTANTVMNYFSDDPNAALSVSGKSTLLIILSLAFPVVTAFIVGVFAFLTLSKKIEELRGNFFLSSIEGSRLNSIDCFRELSLNAFVLSKHVSKAAISSPPSANLQTRPTSNLLKFFKLLEIASKNTVSEDGQQWYVKRRVLAFSFLKSVRFFFLRIFSNLMEYVGVGNHGNYIRILADEKKSFVRLYFKQVNTQFVRQFKFPDYILEDLTQDFSPLAAKGKNYKTATNETPSPSQQVLEKLYFQDQETDRFSARVKVVGPEVVNLNSVVLTVRVPSSEHLLVSSLHQGVGASFQDAESKKPFPTEGNRNFIISKVNHGPGDLVLEIELQSLYPSAFVDFESFKNNMYLILRVENPYSINDATIDWYKCNDMFEPYSIKRLIGLVIDDNPTNFLDTGKRTEGTELRQANPNPPPNVHRLAFKKDFVLRFNPFAHRTLLVLAAIFFDAAEAYRSIVSATGVEFFMDLLVVNGSANIKKW
jgi:hypothetical protein